MPITTEAARDLAKKCRAFHHNDALLREVADPNMPPLDEKKVLARAERYVDSRAELAEAIAEAESMRT